MSSHSVAPQSKMYMLRTVVIATLFTAVCEGAFQFTSLQTLEATVAARVRSSKLGEGSAVKCGDMLGSDGQWPKVCFAHDSALCMI